MGLKCLGTESSWTVLSGTELVRNVDNSGHSGLNRLGLSCPGTESFWTEFSGTETSWTEFSGTEMFWD